MEQRYNAFKNDENAVWKYRFTWRGLYGDKGYHAINIFKFFKETDCQEALRDIKNVNTFYKKVSDLAEKYSKWCFGKEYHAEEELSDIRDFFVGAIGEFFFVYLLNNVSVISVIGNEGKKYDFNFVSPLLKGEKDWGVDMTGVVSDTDGDRNCVMQVKFWNPYLPKKIQLDTVQKAFAEGILNNFIYSNEYHNVVICWLGDEEKSVSRFLKENELLSKHVILIGKKTLNETINERNGIFWKSIVDNLKEFSKN